MQDLIPLRMLVPGQTGQIGQILGCPDHVHRLEELGLRTGTQVQMVQSGSPCIIQLAGNRLCFRQNDAFSVLVQPGATR